jgi:DNA-binding NtrC family response regulator
MAATPGSTKRCVIWFGEPCSREKILLAAEGWQVRTVLPRQAGGIGMRASDQVVGVIDLRHHSGDELEHLEALTSEHRHLPLLGIEPAAPRDDDARTHRLLSACRQRFAHPLDLDELMRRLATLDDDPVWHRDDDVFDCLRGESTAMLAMRATLRKFAPVDLPVLITGETGTGKEAAANALHRLSQREGHPFLAINCGAIAPTLLQSELFGHERGSFTGATARRQGLFENAHRGTVFLDEVGDLPMEAQTSLLRVLQEGTIERIGSNQPIHVDVRVLAATHVDLEQAIEQRRFRADLYYRLNVLHLSLPPLRRRDGDIELLARHFLRVFRARHEVRARGYTSAALQAMSHFHWPGNVRELLNRVQRAAVTTEGELIDCADLGIEPPADALARDPAGNRIDREALLSCLAQSRYNVSACARLMKVSRVTVYRLCRRHAVRLETLR